MPPELSLLSSITLPPASGNAARLLHTVVEDEDGNIYYSDEFNHSIVSLDPGGDTRWAISGKGNETDRFSYPKGIAIGWISRAGSPARCLAVCDSWNGRIQFYRLDGRLIDSWSSAGDLAFKDVTDIRYVVPRENRDAKAGYWLVLDRENHRLCRLATNGLLLSQVGRRFDPLLEVERAASLVGSTDSGSATSKVFDPLAYPDRILGGSEDALFIWEPLPRHLKQIAGDNLHTIAIPAPAVTHRGEWIAADSGGLVSWSRSEQVVSLHDCYGAQIAEARLEGHPVCSRASSARVWMQQGTELRQLECASAAKIVPVRKYPLLESTTEKNIASFLSAGGPWASALTALQGIEDPLLTEARGLLENRRTEPGTVCLPKAEADMDLAIRDLAALWLPDFLRRRRVTYDVAFFLSALQDRSANIQRCLDDILLWKWSVNPETGHPLLQIEQSLLVLLKTLDRANDLLLRLSDVGGPAVRQTSGSLREVDRIFVGDAETGRPAHPNHLVRTPDGHIYVTGWNQLLHLDASGKVLERLEGQLQSPIGVAADSSGRVWVAEFSAERLSVYDPKSNSIDPLNLSGETKPLRSPHGLCWRPDGLTLVADTGNSRILGVSATGKTRTLTSADVRETGRFWFPISVFTDPSGTSGAFWVVDHRNHRLQKFDNEGQPAGEIGGCGIGKGHLILPEYACFLSDGSLMVSQHRFNRLLTVFTPDGMEIERHRVDYAPAGILEQDGFILVANVEGSDIRVYERR